MPVHLRPAIAALQPYRQGRPAPADSFKLSSNENPFPPIPAVAEAIAASAVTRYPDASAAGLRARLAERFGVTVDEVHVGAGSVSIIQQLADATSGPGDEILYSWRSFEAYPGIVTVAGATSVTVPNRADGAHDLVAMAAAVTERTRLILVCSPNNPTSAVVTKAEFEEFMAAVPDTVLVALDEAYREFVTDPIAYLLGFAGGAVVLFGFVWSFLTGYKGANDDSPGYPRPSRVQLVLANAVFGITVLAFLALARDPEATVSLGEVAEYGGQAYGDPLVAAGLLLALWAALRGRELDERTEGGPPATQNAGASTRSAPVAEKASDSAV